MFKFFKALFSTRHAENPSEKYSLQSIQDFVEENINNIIISSLDELGKSYDEVRKLRKRKEIFKAQFNLCGLGDIAAKEFIKSWILDLITQKYGINEKNIHYAINFDFPTTYDKFSILIYQYFNEYKFNALKKFIKLNKLDNLRYVNNEEMFAITNDDVDYVFEKEFIDTTKLKFYEKLNILVQRVYENTLGLSVIDQIRDMSCDGISIGVSGIPIDFMSKISDINIKSGKVIKYPMSYDSIWLYLNGKEISLNFMSFGNQRELERVCRKLYRYNNQKQFTQEDGYIFNNMADISRVTVFRPPYSETWAGFIRKFDIDGDLDELIVHENSDIVKAIIYYLMRAKENICFTGQQGSGKTTMLIGAVKKLYGYVTLRIWESYFETFFRFKLPFRNILTIRETDKISGEKALDSLKKSNGQVTIISESADDQSKAYVIKSALAASECVYWTDHSVSDDELVQTHRNACMNIGLFSDEIKAEEQVLSVLKWNIHLKNNEEEGYRYIDRITEFIRVDTNEYNCNNDQEGFFKNTKLYFEKKTNAKKYKTKNIIEFDENKKAYVLKNEFSEKKIDEIMSKLKRKDKDSFLTLLDQMKGELKKC